MSPYHLRYTRFSCAYIVGFLSAATMLKFEPLSVELVSDISRENQYRKVRRRIPFAVVQCSGYLSKSK